MPITSRPITATLLTRGAALAAIAAGVLFIAVQINHPAITLDFIESGQWTVRQSMKIAMATFALVGIAGMYLRHLRPMGVFGLVGYLLFSLGYLAMLAVEAIGLVVVPVIAGTSPEYVQGIIAVATNSPSTAQLGLFTSLTCSSPPDTCSADWSSASPWSEPECSPAGRRRSWPWPRSSR